MLRQAVISSNVHTPEPTSWGLPIMLKRFGLGRFAGVVPKAIKHSDEDAYLLVLLADQELAAGREEQAACLLDAAYAAFDCATPRR
jgi:hypothetical protein